MKIQYVFAIYLMRWQTNFHDFRFKWIATAAIGIHPTDCQCWWISKMQFGREDTLEERYAIKFCFKVEKMPQKCIECFRLLLDHLAWIEHQFLSDIRDSRKAESLWGMMRGVGGVMKSIHESWLAKLLGLGLLCWGRKRPALIKSGQWHFHQDNEPVHNYILVTDYLTKMGINTVPQPPHSPYLAPCDFWLFPKLRGCRYETIEGWKRLWRRSLTRSHKRTSTGSSRSCWNGTVGALKPEKITSKGTRVSSVYYQ